MNRALPLLMCAVLAACSMPVPRVVPAPPPHRVSTTALHAALAVNERKTTSAAGRVQTITQTVERIITTTDPATAAELAAVRDELFKVTVDLRDAQAATAVAETERAHEQRRADDLHAWGVAQQAEAISNGDGWRKEESARKADNTKSRGIIEALEDTISSLKKTIFKLTLALVGAVAAVAIFFVARQYFPFLKFL